MMMKRGDDETISHLVAGGRSYRRRIDRPLGSTRIFLSIKRPAVADDDSSRWDFFIVVVVVVAVAVVVVGKGGD